jgi:hypothetical protein
MLVYESLFPCARPCLYLCCVHVDRRLHKRNQQKLLLSFATKLLSFKPLASSDIHSRFTNNPILASHLHHLSAPTPTPHRHISPLILSHSNGFDRLVDGNPKSFGNRIQVILDHISVRHEDSATPFMYTHPPNHPSVRRLCDSTPGPPSPQSKVEQEEEQIDANANALKAVDKNLNRIESDPETNARERHKQIISTGPGSA